MIIPTGTHNITAHNVSKKIYATIGGIGISGGVIFSPLASCHRLTF